MKTTLLSLVAIAALTSVLTADDTNTTKSITLEALTVSSTAIKTDELRSTDAVEVYTAKDIEDAHVQSVYEFLNQQTSVTAMPNFGNPFTQKLDMHGYGIGNGYQNIVITINGRRMNNIDMVPQLLSSIAPSSIEKIEIIKSSGIVTSGDGANAGVINITTKHNNDKEITLYGGNYGTVDGSIYLGYSDENISVSASGERQKNGGIRTINLAGDKDENELKNASFNLTYTPVEALEFRLGALASRTDVIYGGSMTQQEFNDDPKQQGTVDYGFGPNPSSSTHQTFKSDAFSAGISYYINDKMSLNIDGTKEKKQSNYITYSSVSDYDYNTLKASFDLTDDLFTLSVGIDGFNGERKSVAPKRKVDNKTDKNNFAGYIMTEWYLDASTIKAGYRIERVSYKYNDISTSLQEKHTLHGAELGYNYMFNKEQSFFANYSHSYQAPDIDRFFHATFAKPPVVTFNGFIDPMQANNFTLGYNYILPKNKFKISAYYVDLKNEIYYHPDPTYVNNKNTNIDKSHKYGIDIYDKWIINKMWNVALNYNYVQAIIDKEKEGTDDYASKKLPGVSNHNAKATLTVLPVPYTALAFSEIYRSEAYAANDFNNNFTQKQKRYLSTNITATYTRKNYEIFAKVNNLFGDKNGIWIQDDAIYPSNFTATYIAGLKLKF